MPLLILWAFSQTKNTNHLNKSHDKEDFRFFGECGIMSLEIRIPSPPLF